MDPTRILLVGTPGLLRDIVRELVASCVGAEVVGLLDDVTGLSDFVRALEPDVVIVGDVEDAAAVRAFLARRARPRTLVIARDGTTTFLYELRPFRTDLGELSPEGLLRALRIDPGT